MSAQVNHQQQTKAARPTRATQTSPRFYLLLDGEPCILDIEFQRYIIHGETIQRHRIGRITILNSKGEVILDVYVNYPREDDKKWCSQPKKFGVVYEDTLLRNGAVPGRVVERWAKDILANRTVVVHGGAHDLTAFYYEKDAYATSTVVDTQHLWGKVNLAKLAAQHLNMTIQDGEHSPVEDAEATRLLYLLKRPYDRAPAEAAKKAADQSAAKAIKTAHIQAADLRQMAETSSKPRNSKGHVSGIAKKKARKQREQVEAALVRVTEGVAGL